MSEIILQIPSKYASVSTTTSTPSALPPPLPWLLRTWTVTDSTLAMWRKARNVRITYSALPPNSTGAARVDDLVEYEALDGKGKVKRVTGIDTAAILPANSEKNKKHVESPTSGDASGINVSQPQPQPQPHQTLPAPSLSLNATSSDGQGGDVAGEEAGESGGKEEEENANEEERMASWNWRGKSWLFFVTSHWEVLAWGEVRDPIHDGVIIERWVVTWFAPTVFTKEGVDFYSDRQEGLSEETRGKLMKAFEKLEGGEAGEVAAMVKSDMKGVKVELPWLER